MPSCLLRCSSEALPRSSPAMPSPSDWSGLRRSCDDGEHLVAQTRGLLGQAARFAFACEQRFDGHADLRHATKYGAELLIVEMLARHAIDLIG